MIHINFECAKCAACTLRDVAYHAGCVRTLRAHSVDSSRSRNSGARTRTYTNTHMRTRPASRTLARTLARSHARTLAHTQQASNAARHIWKETERNAAMWRK